MITHRIGKPVNLDMQFAFQPKKILDHFGPSALISSTWSPQIKFRSTGHCRMFASDRKLSNIRVVQSLYPFTDDFLNLFHVILR